MESPDCSESIEGGHRAPEAHGGILGVVWCRTRIWIDDPSGSISTQEFYDLLDSQLLQRCHGSGG